MKRLDKKGLVVHRLRLLWYIRRTHGSWRLISRHWWHRMIESVLEVCTCKTDPVFTVIARWQRYHLLFQKPGLSVWCRRRYWMRYAWLEVETPVRRHIALRG